MGSTVGALVGRLSEPDGTSYQVLAYLFLARIHNLIKFSYEQLASESALESCNKRRRRRRQLSIEKSHQKSTTTNDDDDDDDDDDSKKRRSFLLEVYLQRIPAINFETRNLKRRKRREQQELAHDNHLLRAKAAIRNDGDNGGSSDNLWDWRSFPELWRPFALYDFASAFWMLYASVRTLLLDQLGLLLDPLSLWLFSVPGHCLLMGRIAVPFAISQLFSFVLASYHLVWRFVQRHTKRNRLLTLIVFLLASERDLEHFYALLAAEKCHDDRATSDLPPFCAWHDPDSSTSSSSPGRAPKSAVDQTECLLRQVVCYRVQHDNTGSESGVYSKVRPNRTREARRLLSRRMAVVTLIALACFALECTYFFAFVVLNILSDYRYVRLYPGCYPLLDERFARGELNDWQLSVTLRNYHRLISGAIFDVLENLIIWGDSGLCLTFVPALVYLLNYDLLLYWTHLNQRLESVLARSIQEYSCVAQIKRKHVLPASHLTGSMKRAARAPPWMVPSLPVRRKLHLSGAEHGGQTTTLKSSLRVVAPKIRSIRKLERDIQELQFELYDFFHQVRSVNLFVGDTLTAAILIWLICCAFVTHNLLTKGASPTNVLIVLLLGFFVLALMSVYLFNLRRCCRKTYRSLCSLMAYDQTRKKRHFMALLDFYLNRDATTYHLCRAHPYEPTTFVTIIGWTFSSFFIVYSLFIPNRAKI